MLTILICQVNSANGWQQHPHDDGCLLEPPMLVLLIVHQIVQGKDNSEDQGEMLPSTVIGKIPNVET